MAREAEVAIIGGGLGGLTLAASLLKRSIPVQVFEQSSELREIGAGVAIGGNATRLLERLDIDLEPRANVPPALEFRRWDDAGLIWEHPIAEWYREEVGAPYLTVHRGTLQRLLAEKVPPERVHLNHRLSGIEEDGEGVRLRFENGGEAFAGIAIGVDGINSVARRHVAGDARPVYSGEIGFRGVIPIEKSRFLPNPTSLHIWCGPGTHVVYYGMDEGSLVNLLAVYSPERLPEWTEHSNRTSGTREEALKIFEEYSWDDRILDLVRSIEGDMNFWALQDLPRLSRWSRGRLLLIGDAAHAPLPHHGQGAGLAIEDAYALGHILAETGPENYRLAFETFEDFRKHRTWKVQASSRVAGRAYKHIGEAAGRRDATFPQVPRRIGWIHRYRTEEMLEERSRMSQKADR